MDFQWQAVFWDFDGVVLDSVHVKTKAFARMFSQYGEDVEKAVVEYHLANGGVSRYEKFKYYYENFLGKTISDEELKELGEQFSSLVLEEVLAAPYIPGALETLRELKEKDVPCYVVSGTPQEEVCYIVKTRGLADFFRGVYGAPRKKMDILLSIMDANAYSHEKCVFLGDAMTDYDAACQTGLKFLGIVIDMSHSLFPPGTKISPFVDINILQSNC